MELIMFVGIPASGKSTWSRNYREQGYLILSSDEIREGMASELSTETLSPEEKMMLNSRVFETIRKKTLEALKKGWSVVVDATNLNRKRRMNFLNQFSRYSCSKKCILFIAAPEVCRERNRKRTGTARVPDEAMHRMLCNFECPNYWEGWDEIIPVVDTEPYRFPFSEIRGLEQDNPHHTLTLDGHLAAAAEFCREQRFGEMLERVAAYHDIGKLYTRQYANTRGEPTVHAHYLGHDNYSAYLYLAEMCCGRELTKEQFDRILHETNLINCHMRPLSAWRTSGGTEAKDRALFGEAFYADLMALHQADRAAH